MLPKKALSSKVSSNMPRWHPTHPTPQIAGERVGKFIVVILDLNYKLMTNTKNYIIMKMTDYKMTDYKKNLTTKKI
jgi:hypothetical protein